MLADQIDTSDYVVFFNVYDGIVDIQIGFPIYQICITVNCLDFDWTRASSSTPMIIFIFISFKNS